MRWGGNWAPAASRQCCRAKCRQLRAAPCSRAAGSLAAKRLAARLLPKFARHFPSQAGTTASVLTSLATFSLSDAAAPAGAADAAAAQAVAEATRAEALQGLSALVEVAQAFPDPKNKLPIKLVDFCFKWVLSADWLACLQWVLPPVGPGCCLVGPLPPVGPGYCLVQVVPGLAARPASSRCCLMGLLQVGAA